MKIDRETKKLVADTMHDVHYWVGMALNAAQTLEYGCKYLLFLLSEQKLIDFPNEKAVALMEGEDKKTFGQILKVLRQVIEFDKEVETELRNALKQRNWFIHDFYPSRCDQLITVAGRESTLIELKNLRKQFHQANEIIKRGTDQLLQAFYGVNTDDLLAESLELIVTKKS